MKKIVETKRRIATGDRLRGDPDLYTGSVKTLSDRPFSYLILTAPMSMPSIEGTGFLYRGKLCGLRWLCRDAWNGYAGLYSGSPVLFYPKQQKAYRYYRIPGDDRGGEYGCERQPAQCFIYAADDRACGVHVIF